MLLLAMAFMIIVTLMILPILTFSTTGIKTGLKYNDKADTLYAADAGIEDAKWQVEYDQLGGTFSTYDPHDYSSLWAYSLPKVNGAPPINKKNVDVVVANDWIPKGITVPSKTVANGIINSTKLIVTGGSYDATGYNIVITYYPDLNESLKINTVGIWLPPGYTYKSGSSNLGSEPTTSAYQGGQAVIWTFSAIAFTSLPEVNTTDSPMTAKITFSYSPSTTLSSSASIGSSILHVASTSGFPNSGRISLQNESLPITYTGITSNTITGIPASGGGSITVAHSSGEPVGLGIKPDAVSWVNTSNVSGLSYTWDDTVRVYHITSIGSTASTALYTAASAGNTFLNVVSTDGFPDSGSLTVYGEPAALTYTGKTSLSFTGIPASGTGSITMAHAVGGIVAYDATSVDTYIAKSELRKIGGAMNGDYYATGNSLMEDPGSTGVKSNKVNSSAIVAAPNPDGADNGVPDDANVSASYLYWGTWYMSDNWATQNSISSSNYSQRCHTLFTDTCSDLYGGTALVYGGSSWSSMTTGTSNALYGVWGSSSSNVFAVGLNGTILKYNGTSWSSMTSGTSNSLYGVWGSSSSNIFAVGLNGTILKYNGTSWSTMTSGTSNTLYGVWGSSASNVFAVGLNGTILKYNGTSWSSMTSGTSNTLYGVWGSSATNVFAVGLNGTILKYNGTSWSSMTSGTTNTLYSVWGSSATNVFAVGLGGTILKYNGTSWSSSTSGTSSALYGVWGSSSSNVFAVGFNYTILKYNGTSWSTMSGGTGYSLNSIWGSGSSNVFAVGSGGNFENGSDWSVYSSSRFRATGNSDADTSVNRDLTQHSAFAFDLGTYPSPAWVYTLSWEQWYSGTAPASTDGLDFSISNDGGTTWSNRVQAFRGSGVGTSGTSVFSIYQYNIPVTYLTSNFKIKYHVVGFNTSGQYVNIDDIRINTLNPDTGITFEINNGSGNKIVYFDSDGNPATSSYTTNQVTSSKTQVILTYSFSGSNPVFTGFAQSCYRDVKALVIAYAQQPISPATNFNGHATYSAIGDLGDTGTNSSAYQLAHAGWSLVTVFTGSETLGHQLYLYDNFFGSGNVSSGGISVVWNGDGTSGGTIKGFVVPQQIEGEVNAAKVTCFVTEGDNGLSGDYISMNGTKLWDGTTSTSNTKSSPNNVWNAQSYLSGGYSMYNGVDIDTVGLDPTADPPQYITWSSNILKPGDTSASITLYTQQDYWFMLYMIISFRSETTTGGLLNYLIHG